MGRHVENLLESLILFLLIIQGGPKKTRPNFGVGDHFDLLSEKNYNLFLDAIKVSLFGISCENINDIAFILCKI